MPDQQARQAQALEDLAKSARKIVAIFDTFNANIVGFARQIAESDEKYDKIMKEKGDMMALIPRDQLTIDDIDADRKNARTESGCPDPNCASCSDQFGPLKEGENAPE